MPLMKVTNTLKLETVLTYCYCYYIGIVTKYFGINYQDQINILTI